MSSNSYLQPFRCNLIKEKDRHRVDIKDREFERWAVWNDDKNLMCFFIPIERIPEWQQYKFLIGYFGDLLIEHGQVYSHKEWVWHIEREWNYEMIERRDFTTGERFIERHPMSINMRTISMKRLAELTELAKILLKTLHIEYEPLPVWLEHEK